jgi:hypothetical protein
METVLAQFHDEGSASTRQPQSGSRIISVDTLRGLTILLMIFVNDLGQGHRPGCTHQAPMPMPAVLGWTMAVASLYSSELRNRRHLSVRAIPDSVRAPREAGRPDEGRPD